MKDTDKLQSYSPEDASMSGLSPRSSLHNFHNTLHQQMQGSPGMPTVAAMGEFSPEMYAQYMYMYNYMYMQQQLAWTNSVYPSMESYGVASASSASTSTTMAHDNHTGQYKCHDALRKTANEAKQVDNIKALKAQKKKSGKLSLSPKYDQRYQPYSRAASKVSDSGSCVLNKDSVTTSVKSTTSSSSERSINMNVLCQKTDISGHTASSSTESPLDLSRKTEKLEYLNTLRHLIESSDKKQAMPKVKHGVEWNNQSGHIESCGISSSISHRHSSQHSEDIKDVKPVINSLHHDSRSQSPNLSREESNDGTSLQSKTDKLGYLSVLKELFEKGHSKTSRDILRKEETEKTTWERATFSVPESTSVKQCKSEVDEDSLDELSVDQSLVIRKNQES